MYYFTEVLNTSLKYYRKLIYDPHKKISFINL